MGPGEAVGIGEAECKLCSACMSRMEDDPDRDRRGARIFACVVVAAGSGCSCAGKAAEGDRRCVFVGVVVPLPVLRFAVFARRFEGAVPGEALGDDTCTTMEPSDPEEEALECSPSCTTGSCR